MLTAELGNSVYKQLEQVWEIDNVFITFAQCLI